MFGKESDTIICVADVAAAELKSVSDQIGQAGRILSKLLEPGRDVLTNMSCIYSHKNGSFYIVRNDGLPLIHESEEKKWQTTSKLTSTFRNAMWHGSLPPGDYHLPEETVEFLNSKLGLVGSGLQIDALTFGGGEIIDSEGHQKANVSGGFCKLSFQAHNFKKLIPRKW